jgi:hypothetical protein
VQSVSSSIPPEVPQPAADLHSWDPELVGEDNNEEPVDNDDEAFGFAVHVEDETDVLEGLLSLYNQDCEADYNKPVSGEMEHFFVDVNSSDPDADVVGGMDEDAAQEDRSIARFLTLPTISASMSNKKWDPIVDFNKSIMLTSDAYIHVVEELKMRAEETAQEKQRRQVQREDEKKRKLQEREERNLQKERKAAERALEKAQKALERESAQQVCKQKATKKAAQKRQGYRRTVAGEIEGEGQSRGESHEVATATGMVSRLEQTRNVEWASPFGLHRTCPTASAFSPYALPSPLSQAHPFVQGYRMMGGISFFQFLAPFQGPLRQEATPVQHRQ